MLHDSVYYSASYSVKKKEKKFCGPAGSWLLSSMNKPFPTKNIKVVQQKILNAYKK